MTAIQSMIYGLKCDSPSCDYNDKTIKFEQYKDYINHPCPVCGSPLLTQEDYDTTMQLVNIIENVNKEIENGTLNPNDLMNMPPLAGFLGEEFADLDPKNPNQQTKLSVELDGTGVPTLQLSLLNSQIDSNQSTQSSKKDSKEKE